MRKQNIRGLQSKRSKSNEVTQGLKETILKHNGSNGTFNPSTEASWGEDPTMISVSVTKEEDLSGGMCGDWKP